MSRLGTEKNSFVRDDKDLSDIRRWCWCKRNRCGLPTVCTPVEAGRCDFCGTIRQVAVSEQVRGKVSICWMCADWAAGELKLADATAHHRRGRARARGAKE